LFRPFPDFHRNLVAPRVFATVVPMADPLDPDAALMLRAKQGERGAFEELVIRHQQAVINFIYRSVPDLAEAEDLAQNAFVQAWKARQRYQPSAKFTTWLFTIARNLTLNELRRRSRHDLDSIDAPVAGDEAQSARQFEDVGSQSAADNLLRTEIEQRVAEAVASLPETQRTAISLCQDEETSYEDIAKVLGCSLSATKSIIFRARETLKERLKPYLQTGEWDNRPSATFPKPR
jgi:RNA polymerase sigma-70 factor, ECF subfamily